MGDINRSLPRVPAEQAFIVTVGVPHERTQEWCGRAIRALQRAGFNAGATSDEAMEAIVEQKRLVDGLVQNGNQENTQ